MKHAAREHARSSVEYATVTGQIVQVTENAILVSNGNTEGWIPRKALSAASRVQMQSAVRGQSVTLQVELRLALEKALV